jgi:heme/copper-type cytochrome/quinol oxidase subunit 2
MLEVGSLRQVSEACDRAFVARQQPALEALFQASGPAMRSWARLIRLLFWMMMMMMMMIIIIIIIIIIVNNNKYQDSSARRPVPPLSGLHSATPAVLLAFLALFPQSYLPLPPCPRPPAPSGA